MKNRKRFPKINKLKDYLWIVSMCVLKRFIILQTCGESDIKEKQNVGTLTEVLTKNQALLFSSQIKYFEISQKYG